jgi:hypothetical protein
MPHLSAEMQQCIDACSSCHETCVDTVNYCLSKGGKHTAPDHIMLLLDCAQICASSADFMLRGSKFLRETCRTCAAVCRACAESCRKMGDDAQMTRCANECDACAKSCERMAGMSTASTRVPADSAVNVGDQRAL